MQICKQVQFVTFIIKREVSGVVFSMLFCAVHALKKQFAKINLWEDRMTKVVSP